MDSLALTGAISGSVAAVGAVAAAVGAWRTEITARWQTRAERLRTDNAHMENELHRARFTEIWEWVQAQPEGDQQLKAVEWLGQHAGLRYPQRVTQGGSWSIPELRMSADEAYAQYITALTGHRGRLGLSFAPYIQPSPPAAARSEQGAQ
jgi:hypothetical protein